MRARHLVIVIALSAIGCSDPFETEPKDPPIFQYDEDVRQPPARDATVITPPLEDGGAEAAACDVSVVDYSAGTQCGLEAYGEAVCPGKPVISGYVYVCRGPELQRPPIEGCRVWNDYSDSAGNRITRVLCQTAEWTPFDDNRCPLTDAGVRRRGYAGPAEGKPGVTVPPPPPGCEMGYGFWGIDGAYGPVCCR